MFPNKAWIILAAFFVSAAHCKDMDLSSLFKQLLENPLGISAKTLLNKIDINEAFKPKSNLDCGDKTNIACVTSGLSGPARDGKSCLSHDGITGDSFAEKLYLELQKCEKDILRQYVDSDTGCVGQRRTQSRAEDIWTPQATDSLTRSTAVEEQAGLFSTALDGCSVARAPCPRNRGTKALLEKAIDENRRAVVMAKKRCKKMRHFFENPVCSECRMLALKRMIDHGCDIEKCSRDPQYWDYIYSESTIDINTDACIKQHVNVARCTRFRRRH